MTEYEWAAAQSIVLAVAGWIMCLIGSREPDQRKLAIVFGATVFVIFFGLALAFICTQAAIDTLEAAS